MLGQLNCLNVILKALSDEKVLYRSAYERKLYVVGLTKICLET